MTCNRTVDGVPTREAVAPATVILPAGPIDLEPIERLGGAFADPTPMATPRVTLDKSGPHLIDAFATEMSEDGICQECHRLVTTDRAAMLLADGAFCLWTIQREHDVAKWARSCGLSEGPFQ
jgi:hypothetical protein